MIFFASKSVNRPDDDIKEIMTSLRVTVNFVKHKKTQFPRCLARLTVFLRVESRKYLFQTLH